MHFYDEPILIAEVGGSVAQRIGNHRAPRLHVINELVVIDALVAPGAGAARLWPLARVLEVETEPILERLLHQQLLLVLVGRDLP